jgi:hypothetical protein
MRECLICKSPTPLRLCDFCERVQLLAIGDALQTTEIPRVPPPHAPGYQEQEAS